jgi:hypothetical protein
MPHINNITQWLIASTPSVSASYRHLVITENQNNRSVVLPEVKRYFAKAHEDAKFHLLKPYRNLIGDSLKPEGLGPITTTFDEYPQGFHLNTLKGYVGEIFSALIAEHFDPFGFDAWQVPVYLFRFHNQAFEELELARQEKKSSRRSVGRTGDDNLAFCMDSEGKINKVLFCEAKCTATHDSHLIADAHEKLSTGKVVNLRQAIEVLYDYQETDAEARKWWLALQKLQLQDFEGCKRYNLASYVCGQRPMKSDAWMDKTTPHNKYQNSRLPLEAVEVHLQDVDHLIQEIYRKEVGTDGTSSGRS